MIPCSGCGKELHDTAPMCPHCGKPHKRDEVHAFAGGVSAQPFKGELMFSKPSRTYFWRSLAVMVAVLLAVGIVVDLISPDDDRGGALVGVIELMVTAGATGLAVRRGWFIAVAAYSRLYGTAFVPPLDKFGVAWRAVLTFVLATGVGVILYSMSGDSTLADLICTLIMMAGSVGLGLYAGERMGWKVADGTLFGKSMTTPPR